MNGSTNAVPAGGGLKILASASVILEAGETRNNIALPAGVKVLLVIASGNSIGWVWGSGECPVTMLIQSVVSGARAGNVGVRTTDLLQTFGAMNHDQSFRQEFAYLALG